MQSDFNHNRGVCVGHRDYQTILNDNERVEELLENGLRLREKERPIQGSIIISTVYDDGASSLPKQVDAIIPSDGINEEGYVKEVYVRTLAEEKDLGDESWDVISAFVHKPDERVVAFTFGDLSHYDLLPSPEIVVKYYLKA